LSENIFPPISRNKTAAPGIIEGARTKKGATMKNAFIRIMAVGVLTTSISAFAMTQDAKAAEENKNSGGANVGTAVESNVSMTRDELLAKVDQLQGEVQQLEANQAEQKTRQDDMNKKIRQQEKEWEHSLLGIYGG
jgi:uncharacterized protein HemX